MVNAISKNQFTLSPRVIMPVITTMNGVSIFVASLVNLVITGLGDDPSASLNVKMQDVRVSEFIVFLAFVYMSACVTSVVFRNNGKWLWKYVFISLIILHIVGLISLWKVPLFIDMVIGIPLAAVFFFISFAADILAMLFSIGWQQEMTV